MLKLSFQNHLLIFEKFLLENKESLPGEQTVYLSGMLARQNSLSYRKNIRSFLLQKPSDLDALCKRHYLYLGQNAPVYFIARINGEYLTLKLLSRHSKKDTMNLGRRFPIQCFETAAIYAYRAKNSCLGSIFSYIYKNYDQILEILSLYLDFLRAGGHELQKLLSPALWKRFASVYNERNLKKEWWEENRVSEKHKPHIHRHEFNQMINFTSYN